MATAFSYSGTGLESAIATGSGGLSSTATSVEVDSIPSDLSAGDTVKIALGTATNFANGNGEVAHGDIGTIAGGANGGTNITGLSRGQEGTTASSFSEGDSVRVGVQGSDDAGPEREIVTSQILDAQQADVYGDFSEDAASADGYTLASGHTLTVQIGSAEVANGSLKSTAGSNRTVVTIDGLSGNDIANIRTSFINASNNVKKGVVIGYQDSNNYAFLSVGRVVGSDVKLRLLEVNSGSESEINSSNSITSQTIPRAYLDFLGYVKNSRKYMGESASKTVTGNETSLSDSSILNPNSIGFLMGNNEVEFTNIFVKLE